MFEAVHFAASFNLHYRFGVLTCINFELILAERCGNLGFCEGSDVLRSNSPTEPLDYILAQSTMFWDI